MRVGEPWHELAAAADALDLDGLDDAEHSHVPYGNSFFLFCSLFFCLFFCSMKAILRMWEHPQSSLVCCQVVFERQTQTQQCKFLFIYLLLNQFLFFFLQFSCWSKLPQHGEQPIKVSCRRLHLRDLNLKISSDHGNVQLMAVPFLKRISLRQWQMHTKSGHLQL